LDLVDSRGADTPFDAWVSERIISMRRRDQILLLAAVAGLLNEQTSARDAQRTTRFGLSWTL